MSLVDLLLEQKIIVISIIAALIPLLLAAGFMVRKRVLHMLSQRAKKRAAQQAEVEARQAAEAIMQSTRSEAAVSQPEPTAPAENAPQKEADKPAEETAKALAEAAKSETSDQNQSSDEIQSLLSSVFADEETDERRAMLLEGTTPIEIGELAQLCHAVAGQLRANSKARGA